MYTLALIMKKDLHPKNYRTVVVQDLNNDWSLLTRSTVDSEETIKWEDGNEYPLVKVHISSASHPFFTGQEKLVDVEGRVDRFKARIDAAEKAKAEKLASLKKSKPKTTVKKEAPVKLEATAQSKTPDN